LAQSWAPTPRANFFIQVFRGEEAILQVIRAFHWPTGVSDLKVMAKTPLFCKMQK